MAPRPKKTLTMEFSKDKETKTTIRFVEDTDAEYKHTFYVSKETLKGIGSPDSFSVVVTPS